MATTTYTGTNKLETLQAQKEATINEGFDNWDIGLAGFITGLRLEWVSVSSIRVKPGAAQIPAGDLLISTADITVSSISLGNNAWGHVYLYGNAGVPAVEVVTTAPAGYFGGAYQKTGVSTRRYLGSVKTDSSGNILNFQHDPLTGFVRYLNNPFAAPNEVLATGTATAETTVQAGPSGPSAGIVPATSRMRRAMACTTSPNARPTVGVAGDLHALPCGKLRLGRKLRRSSAVSLRPMAYARGHRVAQGANRRAVVAVRGRLALGCH
jgi:hypothetical protein